MERIEEDKSTVNKEKAKNIICFFVLGIVSLLYTELTLEAAEDVLSGSRIATTNVIIAIALPILAVKSSAPWFLQKCSYLFKSCVVVCLLLAGLIVLVCVEKVHWRLLGISIIDAGVSFSEITFLALTASYQEVTVSAFVAGIGVSSLLGPLYYTGEFFHCTLSFFHLFLARLFTALATMRHQFLSCPLLCRCNYSVTMVLFYYTNDFKLDFALNWF